MVRSMYSGVAGLRVHQTKMDVIGNNIANVNTVGFKSSRANFSELFYQTRQMAAAPDEVAQMGGTNPIQIGIGATLSSVDTDIETEGGNQSTNRPFDLRINGDAFFIVEQGGADYFTKAGNFRPDENGDLVTSSGAYVMGYVADEPGEELMTDKLRPLSVYGKKYLTTPPKATTEASFFGNINSEDVNFANGNPITEFLYVYDSLGYQYGVEVSISKTGDNTYSVNAENVYYGKEKVDGLSATMTGELTFDSKSGKLETTVLDLTLTGKDSFLTDPLKVDFSRVTQFGTETSLDSQKGGYGGSGTGKMVGTVSSVAIDEAGRIVAAYSNGDNTVIGQIAVTTFVNATGLEKVGNNLFSDTMNSGEFTGVGETISALGGTISAGVLEMSNVDLASEFTDMIVTQRGYQANSRIITTSDAMLEELLSMKR